MILYFIGLIIVSMSVGHMSLQLHGWIVLGVGTMLAAIVSGLFDYLNHR